MMTWPQFVKALGGLGIFLFSLRFLTVTLNQSLASRFRPVLERLLARPAQGLLAGLLATVLVQASSITILATMGLVDSALVTLEQAWFVMLGATVGTTLKAWFFVGTPHLGPALIGVGTLVLLFTRHPMARELLTLAVAIGFAFLGLDMLSDNLAALRDSPWFARLLAGSQAAGLSAQLACTLFGMLFSVAVQSSTAPVILTLSLAAEGAVGIPTGAALILGMNVGTTSTALLASLQAHRDGQRLAVGHFLAKSLGVLITLLFLPAFLGFVGMILDPLGYGRDVPIFLAAVHTTFNLIDALFWTLLASPALSFLRWLLPSQEQQGGLGLAPRVRRMLAGSASLAVREARRQFGLLEELVKSTYDHTFESFFQGSHNPGVRGQRVWLERNLESLKETLHDLLFGVARRQQESVTEEGILRIVAMAELYSSLAHTCLSLNDHLERGFVVELYEVPDDLEGSFRTIKALLDDLWLAVLFPDRPAPASPESHPEVSLEERILWYARQDPRCSTRFLTWLLETAAYMRVLSRLLGELQQRKFSEGT